MNRDNQRGFACLLIILLVAFFGLSLIFLIQMPTSGTAGKSIDQSSVGATNSTNSNQQIQDSYSNTTIYQQPGSDVGIDGLVCINLPGVSYPRTPALSRVVALKLLAVRQELDARGVPALTFSWGFRTTCQQRNVDSGGNLKAKPGTSPHEAGRAVDVHGMTTRPDAREIINTFRNHGWVWLGHKDPPHFEIKGYEVGISSHIAWIIASQTDFNQGNGPISECKGSKCGD